MPWWSRDWSGTEDYWAPEVGRGRELKKRGKVEEAKQVGGHGLNADVWSMGKLVEKIAERCGQSSEFATLVTFACVKDRKSRPTSAALQEKVRVIKKARDLVV